MIRVYPTKKNKTHDVIFYDKRRNPVQKWVSLETKNATAARQKLAKIERDLAFGRLKDPWAENVINPVHRAVDFWIDRYFSSKEYAHPDQIKSRLNGFASDIGVDTPVALITREMVLTSVRKYNTSSSRNFQRQILSAFFAFLVKEGVLQASPAADVAQEGYTSPRTALWPSEIIALKEQSNEEIKVVIDCLVCSGLRLGEFLRLSHDDIDVDGEKSQLLVQNGKLSGETTRTVLLYPTGKEAYQNYKSVKKRGDGRQWIQRGVRRASIKAFENRIVTPHWLRHTYISWMLNDLGIPLQIVSPMVGHKKYSTTRRYAHATDDTMYRMLMRAVGIYDKSSTSPVAEYLFPKELREESEMLAGVANSPRPM